MKYEKYKKRIKLNVVASRLSPGDLSIRTPDGELDFKKALLAAGYDVDDEIVILSVRELDDLDRRRPKTV